MNNKDILQKDFILVVIGQIISLFGNVILRFALPLYLLNQTGSAALFGIISAIAFIPMILLCPVGGIIADRVNKKNVMVILDFSTSFIVLVLCVMLGKVDLVILLLCTLILLYGIQGAYQPAVQASIPALISSENLMPANATINLVNSLSSLIGPVIGGAVYSSFGIMPILYVSAACFAGSAIMEIFIHIPFKKQSYEGNVLSIAKHDLKQSFHFMCKEQSSIFKVCLLMAGINLVMSSVIMIGLPITVNQALGFDASRASKLYGYAEGALAAGGLIGGICAGIFSKKLKARYCPWMLLFCTITILPIALSLHFCPNNMVSYIIILVCCFLMMFGASLFSIQMMAYLQQLTPENVIGKVISCAMCISMCATPLGQAIYGSLFQAFKGSEYFPFYFATILSIVITVLSKSIFQSVASLVDQD